MCLLLFGGNFCLRQKVCVALDLRKARKLANANAFGARWVGPQTPFKTRLRLIPFGNELKIICKTEILINKLKLKQATGI